MSLCCWYDRRENQCVDDVVDCDLNKLVQLADTPPANIRFFLQEIKGIGKVSTDIFCDAAQAVRPCLVPFIDHRSMETTEHYGLGIDVGSMWQAVNKDLIKMCRLSFCLYEVRLDKEEGHLASAR